MDEVSGARMRRMGMWKSCSPAAMSAVATIPSWAQEPSRPIST